MQIHIIHLIVGTGDELLDHHSRMDLCYSAVERLQFREGIADVRFLIGAHYTAEIGRIPVVKVSGLDQVGRVDHIPDVVQFIRIVDLDGGGGRKVISATQPTELAVVPEHYNHLLLVQDESEVGGSH